MRLRGTAHQLYERYLGLGRDAASSGDRIMSENYFQHADHYYRHILASSGPLDQTGDRGGDNDGPMDGGNFGAQQGDQAMPDGAPQPSSMNFNGSSANDDGGMNTGNAPSSNAQASPPMQGDRDGGQHDGQPQQNYRQGQGQHQGHGRDRFNRRFRDRPSGGDRNFNDDRDSRDQRDNRDQRDARGPDRGPDRERGPDRDRGQDRDRGPQRHQQQQRQPRPVEDEGFDPPAFLRVERNPEPSPPRDTNRDDDDKR